jgi:diaminopimelate epimerase
MNFHFFKYQGTGNDFIIADNRDGKYSSLTTKQVKHLCERRFGIGADGLMLLNSLEGYDFEMIYYNADGKPGSMCGNGGRCLVKFAFDMGIIKDRYHFLASDGPHDAIFDDNGWVKLKMQDVDHLRNYHDDILADTGSPHYVKLVTDVMHLSTEDIRQKGKAIRYNKDFTEKGINVNFIEQGSDRIFVRTYERGVEDETFSCGTGVTASALVCAQNDLGFNRVDVTTLGGHLAVEFSKSGEDSFEDIWLCGPATFVFSGNIEIESN